MSVIRRGPLAADNFTIVSNAIIRDARLSLKARGLGIWLLSHTEGWKLSIRSIATQVGAGVEAVQSGLKELEEAGYLERQQQTGDGGKFAGTDYRITDVPAGETAYGKPVHGESGRGEPGDRVSGTHKKTNSEEDQVKKNTPVAGAPEQPKERTENQRANALAGHYYERLDKMGNVPAFMKIIVKGVRAGYSDDAIQKALDYIAENRWTLTAERLRNTLEGGPRPASRPAPSRPSNAARVVGSQLLEF